MADVMTNVDEEERSNVMEEPSSSPPPASRDDKEANNGELATTSAQEAVNSQKSRRSREFEELRKLAAAANRKSEEGGEELSAFERMQLKKQQELDALRARGEVNAANKSRFDTGQAVTTDMSAFERSQKLAAEEQRKKRLEASEGLKKTNVSGMSSWERNQLLGKDEARRRQLEAREGLHRYRLSLDPSKNYDESPEKTKPADDETEEIPEHDEVDHVKEKPIEEKNVVEFHEVIPAPKQEKPTEKEQEEPENAEKTSPPPKAKEDDPVEEDQGEPKIAVEISPPKVKEDAAAVKPQNSVHKPPTYSRHDIKFSFGLVVKSGTTDESLRESETLRKCMNGTRDILTEELPPPPKDITTNSTLSSEVKFPQAYYDPILEPTVISIQEDTSKKPAKGKNNTRTLCKASFPIFIREEAKDHDGKKRAALSLKETKATIFEALRAAVSGGNFLK
eukprot:scaffold2145_cov136-Skeletonema_menzelii.AAC.7